MAEEILRRAAQAVDQRLAAMAGAEVGEPVHLRADRPDQLAPMFIGTPVDAQEALDYAKACADQAVRLIMGGAAPADIIIGALVRALEVGLMAAELDG
jgi:hypothetical protein